MSDFVAEKSPYVKNPARLADLIAAIQVMGTYRFASRPLAKWERRLGRNPVSAPDWLTIFRQHPEFFTIQDDFVSLVWRRSKERNYNTFKRELSEAQAMAATDPEQEATRLSRPPLDTAEISKLVDIAVSLHERGIKRGRNDSWWYTAEPLQLPVCYPQFRVQRSAVN